MGLRGPSPEPQTVEHLRALHGTIDRPKPFNGMSARAKKTWKDIVESVPPGYFRRGALYLLKAYCEAEATHHEATLAVQKSLLVKSASGGVKANPAIAVQTAKASEMAQLATKLKLSVNSYRSNDAAPDRERPKSVREGLKFGGRE